MHYVMVCAKLPAKKARVRTHTIRHIKALYHSHYFCVTEAKDTACVMLVLSPANVPAERKLHNAIMISYGQANLTRISVIFIAIHICSLHI